MDDDHFQNGSIGHGYDGRYGTHLDQVRGYLNAQGIDEDGQTSYSRPTGNTDASSLGSGLGCLLVGLAAWVVLSTVQFVLFLPAMIIVSACRTVGLHPFWGLRATVIAGMIGFGYYLAGRWSKFQAQAHACGLSSAYEWRARRPQGPHVIPLWYTMLAVGLTVLFLSMWDAPPAGRALEGIMQVLFTGAAGGLVAGSLIGLIVRWVDRSYQRKIRSSKGSYAPASPAAMPVTEFL
jgi:NhaP-type Na+/H+ or K+/H+ antiporter